MILRALPRLLLALCLVLTGLAATLAEARMAAADAACGPGAPRLVLDAAGLPVLDGAGEAVEAPDCPLCLLAPLFLPGPAPRAQARAQPARRLSPPPRRRPRAPARPGTTRARAPPSAA